MKEAKEAQAFDRLLTCLIGANELASMRRKQKRKEARELRERGGVDDLTVSGGISRRDEGQMNTTSLAIIQPDEFEVIQRAARMLAVSNYFDGKGDNPQAIAMIATKILAGREMGFGPFASANGIHIISGKPSVSANLMATAVKSNGRYDYRVKEMTADKCVIEFFEWHGDKLETIGVSEFTAADATKAGTKNMTTFPRNMLFARAMSNGVRWFCPDVFSGNAVYLPEELGADVDGEGNIIDVQGRQVESSTGEIEAAAANLPTVDDIIFERDEWTPLSELDAKREEFQALGKEIYAAQWPVVSKRNVNRITGGATQDANALTVEQLERLIDGMMTVKSKRGEQPIATVA